MKIQIKDIVMSKRYRKDLGDIDSLADSIKQVGLIHPITIDTHNNLICGKRRVEALRRLGIDPLEEGIHFRIVDLNPTMGELHENTARKDFLPTEINDIYTSFDIQSANLAPGESGRIRDKVSKTVGMSHGNLDKIRRVVASGDKHLINEMDKGNISVHKAYEQIMQNRKPAPLYLSKERVDLLKSGKLTQISRTFGNWMKDDLVSVHMSNVASIEIVSVSEKRLQDITDEDAQAEGYTNLFEYKNNWLNHNNNWNPSDKVLILKFQLTQ
jgi:hypothetical protein